jgi:hypothetical protein
VLNSAVAFLMNFGKFGRCGSLSKYSGRYSKFPCSKNKLNFHNIHKKFPLIPQTNA